MARGHVLTSRHDVLLEAGGGREGPDLSPRGWKGFAHSQVKNLRQGFPPSLKASLPLQLPYWFFSAVTDYRRWESAASKFKRAVTRE